MRVIFDSPASGSWNMAVDEALLQAAAASGEGTLRFYEWDQPTLSLGHFQNVAEREQHPASLSCPLVRRASGGGAIVHDRELTYSIVLPQAATSLAARDLYELAHQTLISTFAACGVSTALHRDSSHCTSSPAHDSAEPFLCFQRRTCLDIVCRNAKIVGSAQRRRRGAVLQHGSILLAHSDCAPELPGLSELSNLSIPAQEVAAAWLPVLCRTLNLTTRVGDLTSAEHDLAEQLLRHRFAAEAQVHRR